VNYRTLNPRLQRRGAYKLSNMQGDSNPKVILVCQNRTCRQQGAKQVLEAFQGYADPDVAIQGTGCMGKCGSGPMVVVLPEEVWYRHVHPDDVSGVMKRHFSEQ
jgi:(2Fe-2S) ferredoxin